MWKPKTIDFRRDLSPLEYHKATEPPYSVESSSVRQRNAIQMAFRWHADGGPLYLLGIVFRHAGTKKNAVTASSSRCSRVDSSL